MNSSESAVYRLGMSGEWDLRTLYRFGRAYEQVYALLYALNSISSLETVPEHTQDAFRKFPWRGGWSAVNFYNALGKSIPQDHSPRILSIRYSSPGIIELVTAYSVAVVLRATIGELAKIPKILEDVYHQFHRHAQERKLLRAHVREQVRELDKKDRELCEEATREIFRRAGLNLDGELKRCTGNPLARMKIAFSLARRIIALLELQDSGAIDFRGDIRRRSIDSGKLQD